MCEIELVRYKLCMVKLDSVRSNWHSRGFGCDVWTDPPGQTWEDYRHAVDELVMVLEGEVEKSSSFRPASCIA